MKIYHNTRCSKSRCTLDIIREQGGDPEIVEYLKNPPTKAEILALLVMLEIKPIDLIRTNEPIFKEKYKDKVLTDDQCIDAMVEYPILIERPIVVKGGKAIIARPPEKVLDFLS